jgi:hypothetical protein
MRTQCNAEQLELAGVEGRHVVAAFDGGRVSSDAGALLLGRTDAAIGLIDRLAGCFVDQRDPGEIVLDLDATDDPLHGHQEGRFFHGYYDGYCYLPLYIFCGEHLLCAKLRRSNIEGAAGAKDEVGRLVTQIRTRWPETRIILRADSGFCRDELMHWCEENTVEYVFGLARNSRLVRAIGAELQAAKVESQQTQRPARRFKELCCTAPARAGAAHGAWWPRPSRPEINPIRASSSRHWRCRTYRPVQCTKTCTSRAVSARTASRKRSWICLPTGCPQPRSGPISCGYGSHRLPTC